MSGTKTLWLSRDGDSRFCDVWHTKPILAGDGRYTHKPSCFDYGVLADGWLARIVNPGPGECVELTINVTWGEEGVHAAEQSDS